MIETLTRQYIQSYLAEDYNNSSIYVFKIVDYLYSIERNKVLETYAAYFKCLVSDVQYTQKVLSKKLDSNELYDKFQVYVSSTGFNIDYILDSIPAGPESMINTFSNYSTAEIINLTSYPKPSSVNPFSIEINQHAKGEIFILYDFHEQNFYDIYLGKNLPVNGSHYNAYDYHLPVYKLIQKYFPTHKLILTNNKDNVLDKKYIYIQTFTHFFEFMDDVKSGYLGNIPEDILSDFYQNKVILIFNFLQEAHRVSYHFADLLKGVEGLNEKLVGNIFFLSGNIDDSVKWRDYVSGKFIIHKSLAVTTKNFSKRLFYEKSKLGEINFYAFRYFEEAVAAQSVFFKPYTFESKLELMQTSPQLKHFICLNRIVKDYRVALSYFIYKNNLIEKTFLSQNKITDILLSENSKFLDKIDRNDFNNFRKLLPISIDSKEFRANYWNIIPYDAINNSFLWIVTESTFLNKMESKRTNFITEKTYKPMLFFMPFIIAGNHHSLKILKEEGYQTFSAFWDESYDEETDPVKRMGKIGALITHLSLLNKSQILELYKQIKPILEHNYFRLMNSKSAETVINKIINQYNK